MSVTRDTEDHVSTLTDKIQAAEEAGREALDSLLDDFAALADRAKSVRDECKRLTALKDEAERVESVIRTAQGNARGKARDPEPENGEWVDAQLAERAIGAKKGAA